MADLKFSHPFGFTFTSRWRMSALKDEEIINNDIAKTKNEADSVF